VPERRKAVDNRNIDINTEDDIVLARGTGRDMARELGFGIANQTRLATSISELTRNVIRYAGTGVCRILDESTLDTARVRVIVEDNGPGIPDLDQAMQDGFTTGGGMGAGLPGTRRLVAEMDIDSRPGLTKITIVVTEPLLQAAHAGEGMGCESDIRI